MNLLFYNLFLLLYRAGVQIAALWNPKAKLWLNGRKDWRQQLAGFKNNRNTIWIHASSLGEFEQGRPLIEAMKQQYPTHLILLTFFSPSGYEACKNYKHADYIMYLPMDGKQNAADFVTLVQPSVALFIKYEFWHYYLAALRKKNIPTILVSGAFRQGQAFFKWHGGFFRNMLRCFTQLHVQDKQSAELLAGIGFTQNVYVTGDTRYDRVSTIRAAARVIPEAERFCKGHQILIAGSTWPEDEEILQKCLATLPENWKLIVAPHEIGEDHIQDILKLFPGAARFSMLAGAPAQYGGKVLVVDNMGLLSSLYAYGNISWVGGGFRKGGIHNTLEPAVFGMPVIMGPVYEKFVEAVELVRAGVAFPVNNYEEAEDVLQQLYNNKQQLDEIKSTLSHFMAEHTGAATKILSAIEPFL